MDNILHTTVTCDLCLTKPVRGIRYKCTTCDDYDLCKSCEKTGAHKHHTMILIFSPGSTGMSDYSKFVIVAEDELYSGRQGRKIFMYNTIWEIKEDLQDFNRGIGGVSCNKLIPGSDSCHAEVHFISDTATITNGFWKSFKAGDSVQPGSYHDSMVIRILEEKQKFVNQFEERSAADVTFAVNGEECSGDRKHLAGISPVFNTMLYGKFAEAQQDKIVLEGIESAEIFKDFLLAVSPLRIQPNPSNVVALLGLAHQYDVPFLMRNCEDHLMHCYEISIIDRLLLARKYDLKSLELRIMEHGLSKQHLLELLANKREKLRDLECDFLFDIIQERLKDCSC